MESHDPLRPHSHDPNPDPPHQDASFAVGTPGTTPVVLQPETLQRLPRSLVTNMVIVSTGHGSSGPFAFGGVALLDVVQHVLGRDAVWSQVEVVSADGFGTRIAASELLGTGQGQPILLSDEVDGLPLTRAEGALRLIVPGETDDALRQVKWVREIHVLW